MDSPRRSALQYLKGVGPRRAADLQRVGLSTVEDLLYRFPTRYEDRGHFQTIASLRPGVAASVVGEVVSCGVRPDAPSALPDLRDARARRDRQPARDLVQPAVPQRRLPSASARDPVRQARAHVARPAAAESAVRDPAASEDDATERRAAGAPTDDTLHTGRIVPVYEKTGTADAEDAARARAPGAGSSCRRRCRIRCPPAVRAAAGADRSPRRRSQDVHFPAGRHADRRAERVPLAGAAAADLRGVLPLPARARPAAAARGCASASRAPVVVTDDIREAVRRVLPFKLTGDQKTVDRGDRRRHAAAAADEPAAAGRRRLGQDDRRADGGARRDGERLPGRVHGADRDPRRAALHQHPPAAGAVAVPRRAADRRARRRGSAASCWRSSPAARSTSSSARTRWCRRPSRSASSGSSIIDEQHRFGVLQRATLRAKGLQPDVLVMTATPIPRTLALTTYGDLDVSVMREMPPGRQPITTIAQAGVAPRRDLRTSSASSSTQGRQAYVIYPLVEESEKVDLKAATEMADHLAQDVFPAYRVALLHGRMKQDAKDRVMGAFVARRVRHPRLDDGRRSRRGRAERDGDGGRARRAVRPVAAAPAARPRRPRRAQVVLRPAVSVIR